MIARYNYDINFYDVDFNENAFPNTLINFMQDAATKHAYDIGLDGENLGDINLAWMILQWDVEIFRYPKFKEKITIETEPIGFRKFLAIRSFKIIDENDQVIGKAMSKWALVDIVKKCNVDIPSLLPDTLENNYHKNSYVFKKVKAEKEFIYNSSLRVSLNDIDRNGHVNNGKYIYWAFGTIPMDFYKKHYMTSFSVVYKKETYLDEDIFVKRQLLDDNRNYQTVIVNKDDTPLCIINSQWKMF